MIIGVCFAEESLKQPAFYYRVFFTVYASELNTYLYEYYDLFTEDIQDAIIEYVPLLEGNNVYKRDIQCLKKMCRYWFDTRIRSLSDQ